jgi:hypothetical protein
MVAVVGLLGAGFFFDVYMKVNKYVETELKTQSMNRVAQIISDVKMKTRVAQAEAVTSIKSEVADAQGSIQQTLKELDNRVSAAVSKVESDATRLIQLARAGDRDPIIVTDAGSGQTCAPLAANNRLSIDIRRDVSDRKVQGTRTLATNAFSLVTGEQNSPPASRTIQACLFSKIERVVYQLDPTWFKPSEVVRADPSTEFRMSVRIWGPTEVKATIYFAKSAAGERQPIERTGRFSTIEGTCYFSHQANCALDTGFM